MYRWYFIEFIESFYQEHKDSMDINRMSFEIIMELFVRNQAVENNDEDLPF